MTTLSSGPIYKSKSFYKNDKRYELEAMSFIFDCPHCEYINSYYTKEAAETAMDVHFFTIHPQHHVPLVSVEDKERIQREFELFRIRTFSPVGTVRKAAKK